MTSFDSIVIGAGLAGIAATQRLTAAGQRVALVEARPRFGGRVWTRRDPLVDYPLELGPEWFNDYGPIHRLLAAKHRAMPEADGKFLRRIRGEFQSVYEADDGWLDLHRRLDDLASPDRSLESALAECCSDPRLAESAAILRSYVEGFHAADPSAVSLKWLKLVEKNQSADEAQLRARDGLDHVVNGFLGGIGASATVFLETSVLAVRWRRRRALVDCVSSGARATLSAATVVVTLPVAVLRQSAGEVGRVRFTPSLASKRQPLAHLATGPVIKLNLIFDAQFWRDIPALEDAQFIQDPTQPIPTWWTARPVDVPVLSGWAAGPQVARVGPLDGVALRRTAVRSLAHALGLPKTAVSKRLRRWHWHDWQSDPFARGAYSWVKTGGVDAHRALAEPLLDTLYFAGEATRGEGFNATMDGAWQSGWRAAEELLAVRMRGTDQGISCMRARGKMVQ